LSSIFIEELEVFLLCEKEQKKDYVRAKLVPKKK
jgi:hypothetical protein